MPTIEVVSVAIALSALLVTAASLWFTILQPGQLDLTCLDEYTEVESGGNHEIASVCSIRAFVVLSNSGARAALLERIIFDDPFDLTPSSPPLGYVDGVPFPLVQVNAVPRDGQPRESMIRLDGKALEWHGKAVMRPQTIEAGDVRSLELDFTLAANLYHADGEENRDLTGLAELVAELLWMSIDIHASYRTGHWLKLAGRLFRMRQASCEISVTGAHLRPAAIEYWSDIGRDDLARIVERRLHMPRR